MANDEAEERLARLTGYLEADPENPALLGDCARAAIDAGDPELASGFYRRIDRLSPLEGAEANEAGIAAMRSGDQQAAQDWFARALAAQPGDAGVRFNLAWSMALAGDFAAAAGAVDDAMAEALPQAAMLDLQMCHELGRFDEAEAKLSRYLQHHPDYPPLNAVASVLALDLDQPDLAREAASKGGNHPDALTTLGTLDLGDRKLEQAREQFDRALAARPNNTRAEIGLGLVELADGNFAAATERLDRGAEQFGDHLGSWIAAGWAHFLAGDLAKATERFETALRHDDTFGEAQGSMAVVELLSGRVEEAKRRIEVARRLDRTAFSTALATILWEQSHGDPANADQIFRIAVSQPILPNGSTLMDELIKSMGST